MLISTRWHALSLPPTAVVCVLCFCFLRLFAALPETRRSRRQPKADKEHTPKDASDAKHVCASCCDVVGMVSSRYSGQRAPPAIFLYQFTSVLRSLVVETTARRPTRKQTQIVDRPKNMKVRQPTSHTPHASCRALRSQPSSLPASS